MPCINREDRHSNFVKVQNLCSPKIYTGHHKSQLLPKKMLNHIDKGQSNDIQTTLKATLKFPAFRLSKPVFYSQLILRYQI